MNTPIATKLFLFAGLCAATGFSAEPIDSAGSQPRESFSTQQGSTLEHGATSSAAGSTRATTPGPVSGRAAPSAEEIRCVTVSYSSLPECWFLESTLSPTLIF